MSVLKRLVENTYLNIVVGIFLVASGLAEIVVEVEEWEFGAHHGILVMGLVHILKTLSDLIEGGEKLVSEPKDGRSDA
jgi:uncharacterized membrane protein HdeD (DUF308 family)|tara:strand:- start:99 stop:332 length:234 start_codon:yes stop_codon:yes gene_type:complete